MLVIAALLDTDFRASDLWRRWLALAPDTVTVVAHCHKQARHPYTQVPQVPSSWKRTLAPRLELLRAAVQVPGCTHIQLVSEACVPLYRPNDVIHRLCHPRTSTLSLYPTPFWPASQGQNMADTHTAWARKTSPEVWPYLKYHEQWMCLSRADAAALLGIEGQLKDWFRACDADNECDFGTALNKLGRLTGARTHQTHAISWPGRPASFHPKSVRMLTARHIADYRSRGQAVCFFRKVAEKPDLRALYSDLSLA